MVSGATSLKRPEAQETLNSPIEELETAGAYVDDRIAAPDTLSDDQPREVKLYGKP
jgi:hypothetical protein